MRGVYLTEIQCQAAGVANVGVKSAEMKMMNNRKRKWLAGAGENARKRDQRVGYLKTLPENNIGSLLLLLAKQPSES